MGHGRLHPLVLCPRPTSQSPVCFHCIVSPPWACSPPQHEAWPPGLCVPHIHSHFSIASHLSHASSHLQRCGRDPQRPTNGHHSFQTPWQNRDGTLVAALAIIWRVCHQLAGDFWNEEIKRHPQRSARESTLSEREHTEKEFYFS